MIISNYACGQCADYEANNPLKTSITIAARLFLGTEEIWIDVCSFQVRKGQSKGTIPCEKDLLEPLSLLDLLIGFWVGLTYRYIDDSKAAELSNSHISMGDNSWKLCSYPAWYVLVSSPRQLLFFVQSWGETLRILCSIGPILSFVIVFISQVFWNLLPEGDVSVCKEELNTSSIYIYSMHFLCYI